MRTAITLAAMLLAMTVAAPAVAKCSFNICDGKRAKTFDARGLRTGDLYNPGGNRRLQIRNKNLKILGYIEPSGKITDTRRRKLGKVK